MKLSQILGPHWTDHLDARITDMDEADGCGADVLALLRVADVLLHMCKDAGFDDRSMIIDVAIRQADVFYFG